MGIASGSSTCSWGFDCDKPLDSVASTLLVSTGFAGSGTVLTSVTPMALPPPPAPQLDPVPPRATMAYKKMASVMATCNPADHTRLRPQRSCSKKISPFAMGIQRLGDNADVGDPRLLDRVHHRGKSAKGNIFI